MSPSRANPELSHFSLEMFKTWLKSSLVASGFTRLASKYAPRGVAILMYHSVMDEPATQAHTLGTMIHSSQNFREQMELLSRNYSPVTLQEALQFVCGEKHLPARPVVVTFDDGYADNYAVAAPILNQAGVPATFYITVDCVQEQKYPWPARVRYAFLATRKREWTEPKGTSWPLHTLPERTMAFERASEYCGKLAGQAQENHVRSLELELGTGPPPQDSRAMMTWDEVRGLLQQGHIVGSHTMTHPNMAHVDADALKREFVDSKRVLERELAGPVTHFSYPCPALQPHWTELTLAESRHAEYQTAVTTIVGLARRRDNPLSLRRIRPTKSVDGLRWNMEYAFMNRRS
jgi:peptidoglycan/xylan/chitin deacetylase (PgdA/CDA1 family)